MFSLSPIKATYQEKNNYLALHRPGSLLMEWVPIKEPNHLQWDQKKQFNLGVKQIGQLLQFKYQPIKDTNINSPQFKRRFSLQKSAEDLNLIVYQDDEESKDKNPYSVKVTMPEFYTILELSSFALPFLVGWQALYNPQYVDVADE